MRPRRRPRPVIVGVMGVSFLGTGTGIGGGSIRDAHRTRFGTPRCDSVCDNATTSAILAAVDDAAAAQAFATIVLVVTSEDPSSATTRVGSLEPV